MLFTALYSITNKDERKFIFGWASPKRHKRKADHVIDEVWSKPVKDRDKSRGHPHAFTRVVFWG
jgi:hypothetical protein